MEHRSGCVSGRWDPCHVLQFIVDSGDRVVRVDTKACLQGERDAVGAFSNSRDMSIGARLGALFGLRIFILYHSSIGDTAPDTGATGWEVVFFSL